MDIGRMRVEVSKKYPGKKWQEKVRKMSDGQVIAIHYKFLNEAVERKVHEDLTQKLLDYENSRLGTCTFDNCVGAKIDANCISFPYTDVVMFGHLICSKETMLDKWIAMIGQDIDIDGRTRKITKVSITGDYLFIDLQ